MQSSILLPLGSIRWSVRFVAAFFLASALVGGVPALASFTEQGATILGGVNLSGRSASLADIDNDGDLDLLFQGAASGGLSTPPVLMQNNLIGTGAHTFTNITAKLAYSLSSSSNGSWSAAWGDYDGDGKIDVFIGETNSGSTAGALLKNNWPNDFSNVSATTINDPGFHQNVAWGDFNNDRRLDLVIGMEGPEKHQMYLQNANGTFTASGAAVGIQAAYGTKSYGLAIGDYDGDGDMDLYISTCISTGTIRNNFYKNMLKETGTLSYIDVADTNGTQNSTNTYGAEFVDFDNDGKLDLLVTGADGQPSKIYRNNGNGSFTDVDTITGHALISNVGTDLNGFNAVDYDNDGDLDLYFHDNLSLTGSVKLYRNDGGWQFIDVTTSVGIANTGAGGYDGVWGDIDRDGDQDLINPNNGTFSGTPTPERVYINDASTNGNHWLYAKLAGPSWNTTGIGSSLYATLNAGTPQEVTLRREANTNAGTFNQSDLPVHFGLGDADIIDLLRIRWPDGSSQSLYDVAADEYLTIRYLPGDYNGNGVVDAADYAIWRENPGDFYTLADYDVWRRHFGQSLPGSGFGESAAVPEPATAWQLLAAMALLSRTVKRRRVLE